IKSAIARWTPAWTKPIRNYYRVYGRVPNVIRPRRFSEKVIWRIMRDRRPVLLTFEDKVACRAYVQDHTPGILTELYYLTEDPETIPFDSLPSHFVVKASHGSGWVKVIAG